jgi:hypothetical protein
MPGLLPQPNGTGPQPYSVQATCGSVETGGWAAARRCFAEASATGRASTASAVSMIVAFMSDLAPKRGVGSHLSAFRFFSIILIGPDFADYEAGPR